MTEGADLFVSFFRAVHGVEPFAWQRALAERVIDGPGWPRLLDVPTGMGKTAAVDVALVALASQADLPPEERTAPTRIFVVVDRRLLVDQAFDRARHIASALESPKDEAVRRVAEGLRRIGGGARPLEVVRMRGGVTWSWRWLASPAQPAVIAGTVDQFGSRMLFRGYGVGERLRTIDAALCGRDALVLLDEAHLAPAMVATLERARSLEDQNERSILGERTPPPVLLSATLRSVEVDDKDVVRMDSNAESSPAARRRLTASRRMALCELDAKGREGRARLAQVLAGLVVKELAGATDEGVRVAAVANTVATARAVFENLRAILADYADIDLLVGRCRGFERDNLGLAERIRRKFGATDQPKPSERPAVLVATQTIEVGADLDFDAMVTEAGPLDALLQRLGRLNRFGHRDRAEAVCVFAPALHGDDPVYGDAVARTWSWLRQRVNGDPAELDLKDPSADDAPRLELGLSELSSLVGPEDIRGCAAEPAVVPVLLSPHLDAWSRTSPSPDPDQPVEPFLHGLDRGVPEVSICWRAMLPSAEAWKAELEVLPITDEERVEVPLWVARRFLRGLGPGDLADLEGMKEPEERERELPLPRAYVQRADGSVELISEPFRILPGDTIILDPEAGGHDAWGWTGMPGTVTDVADLVPRHRRAIRLRPAVLAWATGEDPAYFRQQLMQEDVSYREKAEKILKEAVSRAKAREESDVLLQRWIEHAESMLEELQAGRAKVVKPSLPARADSSDDQSLLEVGLLVQGKSGAITEQASDTGEATSSVSSGPVSLSRHLSDVAQRARSFAKLVGLPPDLVRAIELSGLLHDVGKAEFRFQVMLHRGDPDRFEASGELLAKSGMDPSDRRAFRRTAKQAGVPRGWRHEAVSMAIAKQLVRRPSEMDELLARLSIDHQVNSLIASAQSALDELLVLHLVASHHGCARPLFPPVEERALVDLAPLDGLNADLKEGDRIDRVEVDHVDWSGPQRLLTLCRRYGWWGLALLEAIVRLADIAVSEEYR